jgi:hypothetical protein
MCSCFLIIRTDLGVPQYAFSRGLVLSKGVSGVMQMEGMVTDLQLAKDKQVAFDEWKRTQARKLPIDLSVTVLTTGFWPTYKVLH